MKSYDTDEELERALFALELEEPPADLRASILAATIYRTPLPVKAWEVWVLGAVCALLAWLLAALVLGQASPAVSAIEQYVKTALAVFAQPQILLWIAIGGGAAAWISQLNLTVTPEALRANRR